MSKITQHTVRGLVKYHILENAVEVNLKNTLLFQHQNVRQCHAYVRNRSQLATKLFDGNTAAATNSRQTTPNQMMKIEKNPVTDRHFDIFHIVQDQGNLFLFFHIWLHYEHCYLFLIVLIGVQVPVKLLDLLCFGHSYIHLRLSVFQTVMVLL